MPNIKIAYENMPSGVLENSTTTATYPQTFVNFNDFKTNRVVPKYATLEQGRNKLDGTFLNMPNNPTGYGYLSTILTDENGDFANNIVITRTYSQNYTSPGIMVEFDTYTDEHPRTMNVKWYRGTTLLEDQTYNVDNANYFCDTPVSTYNKVVITIGNMTRANRFLKIFNISDGLVREFYNEEIENLNIIEQITNNNKTLSINEASVRLLPLSTRGVQFQRTLPFYVYRNEALLGRFYIKTSTSNTNKTLFDIKLNDFISILDGQTYYGGLYSATPVSTIIAEIMGDIPYTLNSTIGATTITGYLPIMSKRDALQKIAFCVNALIDTSRQDDIKILQMPTTSNRTITPGEIISIKTTEGQIVTEYQIEYETLTATNEEQELFNETLNGTRFVTFSQPMHDLTITGGAIVSSNINCATISGTGSNVTLTGKSYDENYVTYTKSNSFTISTDIPKVEKYTTTIVSNITTMLNNLNFVHYNISLIFIMYTTKVGDIVLLNGQKCRVLELNYDCRQSTIYCNAKLEAYYE